MAKKGDRENVQTKCKVCGNYARPTERNKKNSGKLTKKRYCEKCNKHQEFTETK